MPARRNITRYALLRLTLAVMTITMIVGFAATFRDFSRAELDILAPLRFHLFGLALVSGLAFVFVRRVVAILIAGLLVLPLSISSLSWANQTPSHLVATGKPRAAKASAQHAATRLMFLNTWHENTSLNVLYEYLKSAPADVLVMAEFGRNKRHLLAKLRNQFPYQTTCRKSSDCSLVVISRIPFVSYGFARMDFRFPPVIWVKFAPRRLAKNAVTVFGTHVHRPTRNPARHVNHLKSIERLLKRTRGQIVLAGDFNAPVWSNGLKNFLQLARLKATGCYLPSWPAWPLNMPQFAIDHILVSEEMVAIRAGLGKSVGSDHLPVWIDLGRDAKRPTP